MNLEKVSLPRRVLLGSAGLLFIWSLFPWNGQSGKNCVTYLGVKSCAGINWSVSGWHGGWGTFMGIFLIALIAWEGALLLQVLGKVTLPELPVEPILVSLGIGALTVLFGVIRFFDYGYKTWEIFIALLLLLVLAGGLFLRFGEGEQAPSASAAPPAPPAPPAAPPM